MKFNIDEYKGDNIVMRCRTQESAEQFLKYLDSVGRRWCSGTKYTKNSQFVCYKDRTCYRFNRGEYGSVEYFEEYAYEILEFEDFDWGDEDSNETPEVVMSFTELFK